VFGFQPDCALHQYQREVELMRGVLLSLVFAMALGAITSAGPAQPAAAAPAISATAPVYALQVPEKRIDINIGDRGGYVAWYRNPVWVAIGVVALALLLLIIVLALRGTGGGGTTIIKE
jgi:hypothetical protein